MSSAHPPHNNSTMVETMEELRKLKRLCIPMTAINLVTYLRGMITVTCLGRLGALELAGGALAVGFTNMTGYSVLSGLASGLEPICAQAFGSGNLPLAVCTLRRTILMLLLSTIPIALLWANLGTIMLRLGQDSEITHVAASYCLFSLPDLLANSLLHPLRVYFRSRSTPLPLMWCTLLAVVLHLPLTLFLSSTLRMGVPGVALATCCTNFNTLLFLFLYMRLTRLEDGDGSRACGREQDGGWAPLVRLALPSWLAICLEWWWYELMTLAAGYLPRPRQALGASAILIQTTSVLYAFPASLGSSVSARVGNELGAGRAGRARVAAAAAIAIAVVVSYLGLLFTAFGRDVWVRIFSDDPEVVRLARGVLPVIGLCELGNCLQTTGCGVLRGSARPTAGAAINLYAFYLVGAPLGVLLAFPTKWGFAGLCFGLLAAQVVCAVSVVGVVCRTDWEREASKAKELGSGCRGADAGRAVSGLCGKQRAQGKSAEETRRLLEGLPVTVGVTTEKKKGNPSAQRYPSTALFGGQAGMHAGTGAGGERTWCCRELLKDLP